MNEGEPCTHTHRGFRLAQKWQGLVSVQLLVILALSLFLATSPQELFAADSAATLTGEIAGAAYKIEMPANWNGTLLLYSHGYVFPGAPNPATDSPDPLTASYLLGQGYALVGSSYSSTGWALENAFKDQIALLDYFNTKFTAPRRTIAWGTSMGGLITTSLSQLYPQRLAGALPMCALMQGSDIMTGGLDATFVAKTLLAPDTALEFPVVTNPQPNQAVALKIYQAAQNSRQGRARLALAAALGGVPGWFAPGSTEPASTDYAAQEQNQYLWLSNIYSLFYAGIVRFEFVQRVGGNSYSNVGVDYSQMLNNTPLKEEVQALYSQAGLNLADDLRALANAPRVGANPGALDYARKYIQLSGQLQIPLLSLHTSGDGLVPVQGENYYAKLVEKAGDSNLLRQLYIHRANHCTFTPAEMLTALKVLTNRLDSGQWDNISDSQGLNNQADVLGANLNVLPPPPTTPDAQPVPTPPAFFNFSPAPLPRDYLPAPSLPLPPTGPDNTAPTRTFPETSFSLQGQLLSFWDSNGGLPVFGFPIDSLRQSNGRIFQWLERNRLELHPENQAPYQVELGLLGVEALARQGIDWNLLPKVSNAPAGCLYFKETSHSLCGGFLSYWQSHGLEFDDQSGYSYTESLALLGYPISEPKLETNSSGDTVLTQWFERGRMELHPENAAPYRILLGRLGAECNAPLELDNLSA